ncbi:transporter [Lysobacter fragariae]
MFFVAALLVAGIAHAEDGMSLGVGVDYSSGDYGSDTTTKILSVPFTAKYTSGDWSFKASLPWMRVDGDANVVPGLGEVININPHGRGRGNNIPPDPTAPTTGTTSGIGDLRLSATYSIPTGNSWGVDLTGNVKVATADEDKGLGTGANDYGAAVDVYRDFNGTTLFGGVSYTVMGDSDFIDVDSVAGANFGASWKVGGNHSLGLMYDWRQAASDGSDDRSEITGFYSLPTSEASKLQVYATKGLSDGSPDWGGGVNFTAGF